MSYRHSADGETYKPGDQVSYAEALRQGLIEEIVPEPPDQTRVCSNCKGSGKYAWPVPKGHKPGCGCKFCGPCRRCDGSGRERVMMPATEGVAGGQAS